MKYWLKACPKCHGDLDEEEDRFGAFISCVQCGYILQTEEEAVLLQRPLPQPMLAGKRAA